MADIKIYGKLVANTEDQVVADASSIQDTARNQKLSETLNELAQGTGLKVLDVNLNNYLSQDGLLALIQGINYATIGDAISYQFSSSIAVDSSYNAVHVTASVSGQGGIDLYLLKSINEKFSCETLVSDGYSSKYKTIQHATLITSSGYIRGIVVTNSLVGNLCDLVNGRSELTSTKLTYWFPVGVLPTHIKLANDIIIDLQGNEYCAIGSETVDAEISNRVYLNVVKIDINGDFSSVSANDVKVVDFLWQHIENPSSFSFDDLPRFSDSSDVADFPGSSGGSGSGGSGKLYEFSFPLTRYDYNGEIVKWSSNTVGIQNADAFDFSLFIYESNWERFKQKFATIIAQLNVDLSIDKPQDLVDLFNQSLDQTSDPSDTLAASLLILSMQYADRVIVKNVIFQYDVVTSIGIAPQLGFVGTNGIESQALVGLKPTESGQEDYFYGLNVNNSCTLTEYGTSASSGSGSSETTGGLVRYIAGVQDGNGNARKLMMYFNCSKSEIFTMLNQGFAYVNTQFGSQIVNANCQSTSDIVANLDILKQIDTTGGSDPDNNSLIFSLLGLFWTNDKCVKVTGPMPAEEGTTLNTMDLMRYGYDKLYYINSSGNITLYSFSVFVGNPNVTYTIEID